MLSDRIELHRQLAETQQRAERAEATCAALIGTLRAIRDDDSTDLVLFERRTMQRVREALAAGTARGWGEAAEGQEEAGR